MRGLSVFTGLLLVVNFVGIISGSSFYTEVGRDVTIIGFDKYGYVVQCTAEHNGVLYSIYPESNATFLEYNPYGLICQFTIRNPDFIHSGEWIVTAIFAKEKRSYEDNDDGTVTEQFSRFLHVRQDRLILPETKFYGDNGYHASLYFEKGFDSITKFYIVRNEYHNFTNYVMGENGNGTLAGLKMNGRHGLQMPIDEKWSGKWRLIEESGDCMALYGDFEIHWEPEKISLERVHQKWNLGESDKQITSNLNPKKTYIEIERPDGKIIPLKNSKVTYAVKKVSHKHEGIWKLRYLSKSNMNILEREINVTVIDPREINVVVTRTDDHAIHMLCKTNVGNIGFCQFTSPNGIVIHPLTGVGNDKYEFFGTGYSLPDNGDDECGLTIRKPIFDDYGLWKCTLAESHNSENALSAYVPTDNLRGKISRPLHVTAEDIYVKRGDKFSIKCSMHESLDYCWLRSPNGTNYSVRKLADVDIHTPNNLPYFGEGLSVGVCGATIENANYTDAGNWSCRLGVTGGVEKESTVAVTVTDSYITPIRKTINLALEEPKLVVKLLPSVDATIDYCRWIRPDGYGLYQESAERYYRAQTDDTCSLFLDGWNPQDVGIWSCYVRLSTGSDEELYTTVRLADGTTTIPSNMSMTIIVISLVGTTILAVCILGYIFYKKRMSRPSNPPAYFNEFDTKHFAIPVAEKTQC